MKKLLVAALAACSLWMVAVTSSCKKDFSSAADIYFSTDTLTFDTVFTNPFSSTTRYFKIINRGKSDVTITHLHLSHLVGNQFRINVDGVPGDNFSNITVPAEDSLYVFVEVTVEDPNSGVTPFVIIDDVTFQFGDEERRVHLQAWGQRAYFHYGEEISTGNVTWTNDLPHVVVGNSNSPGVFVRNGASLTINPGVHVYVAGNSAIFVEGNLTACSSSWADSIVFEGVRLESYYNNKPGQWFGIVFLRTPTTGATGSLCHCVINESTYSLYVGAGLDTALSTYTSTANRPQITVSNCIIKNSLSNAMYGFNGQISAVNTLCYAAGENLLKLGLGGSYDFSLCTFYNNGSQYLSHQDETLLLSNFVADGNQNIYPAPLDNATFSGCVIYGNLEDEIAFNKIDGAAFNFNADYNLIKNDPDTVMAYATLFNSNIFNEAPRFESEEDGDFTPSDSIGWFSPLIDKMGGGPATDLFDQTRPVDKATGSSLKYDIGAVEAQ